MTWRGGLLIPEFRSKPRPQLPNRHRLAVDADPIPGIRFGALLELADENDMTARRNLSSHTPTFGRAALKAFSSAFGIGK
jgi:hypothetical protein